MLVFPKTSRCLLAKSSYDDKIERHKRQNSGGHSQLVRSRLRRAVVSEAHAGRRSARLVRWALRDGGSELDVLFGAQFQTGRTMVPHRASDVYLQHQIAQIAVTPFSVTKIAASDAPANRGNRSNRESETDTRARKSNDRGTLARDRTAALSW